MADQDLREHQLRAVKAMKLLDSICVQNGIGYFLIAGSTLGAIRHHGFIPWDDDIDIAMPMCQFLNFLKIAPSAIKSPYCWKHTSVDDTYPTLSGGIYFGDEEPLITVFPLIKLSNNKLLRKTQWIVRKIMSPVWQRKVGYHIPKDKMSIKQRVSLLGSTILSTFISKEKVLGILSANELKYEDQEVEWYCNIYSKYSQEKESIKREWTEELIRVPFEDMVLPIIKEYDAYLTHLYGDYMTPPPEKERHPVHL